MNCPHCKIGRVVPKYRKGKRPTYRCNHCKRTHIPREKRDY